jgi:hypothetical protein
MSAGGAKPDGVPTELAPAELLAHAEFLARHADDTDLGRVHARRAVSAAYYAAFHLVALSVARTAAPAATDDERYELCRAFTHTGAARVARWLRGEGTPPERSEPLLRSLRSPATRTLGGRLLQLQEWRHEADYDHRRTIGAARAGSACLAARALIHATAAAEGEPGWTSACTLMLLHATGRSG